MYRTKTYIAADWDNDKDVLEVFEDWKENNNLSFDYRDAHELIVSRDSSLKCSIKKSIREKIKASKKFVLIVGEKTKNLTNGSCHLCDKYIRLWKEICIKNYNVDSIAFIQNNYFYVIFNSHFTFIFYIASKINIIILYAYFFPQSYIFIT